MIIRKLNSREEELLQSINAATFAEIVAEVRASLPPTKTMRSQYMRNLQGLV